MEASDEEIVELLRRLSPRQRELLRLLGSGESIRDAAGTMGISRKTATGHKCQLMYRIEVTSREELVVFAKRAEAFEV